MDDNRSIGNPHQRGLTLIELLVTLVIVALSASVVVLSVPVASDKSRETVDGIAAKLQAASHHAVISNEIVGMDLTSVGIEFYKFRNGVWTVSNDAGFSGLSFPQNLTIEFEFSADVSSNERAENRSSDREIIDPNVLFFPTGEATPFSLQLVSRRSRFSVSHNGTGDFSVQKDG